MVGTDKTTKLWQPPNVDFYNTSWHLIAGQSSSDFLVDSITFNPCIGPGYFLLWLKDWSMLETYMQLAVPRVLEHW